MSDLITKNVSKRIAHMGNIMIMYGINGIRNKLFVRCNALIFEAKYPGWKAFNKIAFLKI